MNITERKPLHTGKLLLEAVIKPLGMTITETAKRLGVTRQSVNNLIHEDSDLSLDMAMRIAIATGTSVESWYERQVRLNLWKIQYEKNPIKNVMSFPGKKTA